MQILFAIALLMLVMISLSIGNMMSVGYVPYSTMISGLFYFFAMFIPFMGEYSVIHRSFSSMGDNFKKIIGTQKDYEKKGDIEIIAPGGTSHKTRTKPNSYSMGRRTQPLIPCVFFLVVATVFFGIDLVNFYVLDGAPKINEGPISNF